MKKLLTILFLFVSSIAFAQHQWDTYVTASGTDTYAVTVSVPTMTNYSTKRIHLRFANANTGTSTLNVTPIGGSPLGAVAIRAWDGDSWEPLAGGEIATGQDYVVVYNGTYFELYPSISGGSVSVPGDLENVTETGTTYTLQNSDAGKMIHFTNASGVTVTMPNTITADKIFYFTRDIGAGTITFDDDGTSVLEAAALTLEEPTPDYPVVCSWAKIDATTFQGYGQLGSGSAALTNGEGTTANGSAVDLGGAVTTTRTFTGTGNWNWGSDATPYSGFLNFKGLYTGSVGGFSSQVRTAATQYSLISQFAEQISMSVRDATSSAQRTGIAMDGASNGVMTIRANNNLNLQTYSDNYHFNLDDDDGISLKLGSDAPGDIYYRNSSGFLTRLGVGSDDDVLTLVSGIPSWAAPSGGGGSGTVNSGTAGQIAYYAGSGTAVSGTTTGTGVLTALGINTGSSGAFVVNGGALGTPSSGVGTNITGIPQSGVTNLTTDLAGKYSLASGGTLAGANTFTGTTSNTVKYVFDNLGTTQTNGAGLWFANTTAAAAGSQQISPSVVFEGQGWKTDATAASQSVKVALDMLPVQGAANPSVSLRFRQSINGGAYSNLFSLIPNGNSIFTSNSGGTSYSFQLAAGTNYFRINETGSIFLGSTTSDVRIGSGTGSTFGISGSSLIVQSGGTHHYTTQNSANLATAAVNVYNFTGAAMTGSGGSNQGAFVRINPVYNTTGGTSPVYDMLVEATETAIAGAHYGVVNPSTTARNGFGTLTPSERLEVVGNTKVTGNVTLAATGNKLYVKEGSNASLGNAVLVGGTVTVNTTAVTANSEIFLTHRVAGGTLGVAYVGTITAGTSFVINSTSSLDTSTISWFIVEPAP